MNREQAHALTEKIAELERSLAVANGQVREAYQHLRCSRFSHDRPLQPHGPSKVCQSCYDLLRSEHARVAVVVGSIRALLFERMSKGIPCPFCHQLKRHSPSCYLDGDAGTQLLDEYRAIEQHRDMLLADKARMNADLTPGPPVTRVRLKGRFPHNGHGG